MGLYVIEGLDGSGKSTMAKAVVEKLVKIGKEAVLYRFPSSDTPAGRTLRGILDGHETVVDKKALLYLFAADIHELKWRIGDDLANRRIVICDRHPLTSAWVYQTDVWGFGDLYTILQPQLMPNITRTFLLHVSPTLAMERIEQRGIKRSLYEDDFVRKASKYQALSQMQPFGPIVDLDGYLPINTNADLIINTVLG
jgi:dTMP kinase